MPTTGGNRVAQRGVGNQRSRRDCVVASPTMKERQGRGALLHRVARLVARLVARQPGRTELELTRAIYGRDIRYTRVNIQIRLLIRAGKVRREGAGYRSDPYRYFPATED